MCTHSSGRHSSKRQWAGPCSPWHQGSRGTEWQSGRGGRCGEAQSRGGRHCTGGCHQQRSSRGSWCETAEQQRRRRHASGAMQGARQRAGERPRRAPGCTRPGKGGLSGVSQLCLLFGSEGARSSSASLQTEQMNSPGMYSTTWPTGPVCLEERAMALFIVMVEGHRTSDRP